jgi:UDP-glucose 4-epimerase
MKRVLILGGSGFIGTNILSYIDQFLENEYEVVLFIRGIGHCVSPVFKCVKKVYIGDFSDNLSLVPIFEEQKIDLVIHLISTTVPNTSNNFRFDVDSNLIPTLDFLNLMINYKCKDIVYLSSGGAVYGNSFSKSKESDLNHPNSSYGIVKLSVERYLMLYSQQGLIKPLILRLSNPYGQFHTSMKQGIINVALRSALHKKAFYVWGDGEARKDYIYIEDFTSILFKLIKQKVQNEIVNIGSGNTTSINEILNEINNFFPDFKWGYKDVKNFDVNRNDLDTSKLISIIGNYDFIGLKTGIYKTYHWLQKQELKSRTII